jgi:hypothetical protein
LEDDETALLDAERDLYYEHTQEAYGALVNPITGDKEDIMDQCINLHLSIGEDNHSGSVADQEAYDEVLRTFRRALPSGMKAWTKVNDFLTEGVVNRYNHEDGTVDFRFDAEVRASKANGGKDKVKTLVKKDVPRMHVKTQPGLTWAL